MHILTLLVKIYYIITIMYQYKSSEKKLLNK